MIGLKPIKIPSAKERVASELRKAILSKQLKEGENLTLESVAQQLNVSITPVREAFQILAHDGLIKLRPNKGKTWHRLHPGLKSMRLHFQRIWHCLMEWLM